LSKETGGRFFEVSKKEPISQIYAEIEQELRSQYNLGFAPDKTAATPGYHKITLTTNNKDLTVQAQEGYFAGQ
jgi:VWFA-related protein